MEKKTLMSQLNHDLRLLLKKYSLDDNNYTLLESNELSAFFKKQDQKIFLEIKVHDEKLEFSRLKKIPTSPIACCAWCSEENVVYCCVEGPNCGEN